MTTDPNKPLKNDLTLMTPDEVAQQLKVTTEQIRSLIRKVTLCEDWTVVIGMDL